MFLRQLEGIRLWEALVLAAYCVLYPLTVYFSGSVLSDMPFAVLALASMVLAENVAQRDASDTKTAFCALLTGLSMLMRAFGVPIAAGVLAAIAIRRAWRQFFIFCGCIAPFFAALVWRAIFRSVSEPSVPSALASSVGWIRAWTYYMSYVEVWKVGVPSAHIFWAMLRNNMLILLRQPAFYLIFPTFVRKRRWAVRSWWW